MSPEALKTSKTINTAKTIQKILEEFLAEQQARLSPKTYSGYKEAIHYFRTYLDGYGHQHLSRAEREHHAELSDSENKEFWEIFGSEHLGSSEIEDSLADFMARKVVGSRTVMEPTGRAMLKLMKWLYEKGYMQDEEFKQASESLKRLKPYLPAVGEVSDLILWKTTRLKSCTQAILMHISTS